MNSVIELALCLVFDAYFIMEFGNVLNYVHDGGLVVGCGFDRYKAFKDLKEEIMKQYYDLQELVSGLVPLCVLLGFS